MLSVASYAVVVFIAVLTFSGHALPAKPEKPAISYQPSSVPEPLPHPQSSIVFPESDGTGSIDIRFGRPNHSRRLPTISRRGRRRRPSSRIYFPGEEVPTIAPHVVEDPTPESTSGDVETVAPEQTRIIPEDFSTDHDDSLPFIVDEPPARNTHEETDRNSLPVIIDEPPARNTHEESLPFIEDVSPPRRDNTADVDILPARTSPSPFPPTPTSSSHSAIHFDQPPRPRPQTVPECGGVPYVAYNNRTGDCQELWSTNNCPEGFWFVLSQRTHEGMCLPRRCPKERVFFKDACMEGPAASELCPSGMTIFVNEYGDGFCDCKAKHAYWASHGQCYPVYRRGPCNAGEYLVVPEGSNAAACFKNECPDGQVSWTELDPIQLHPMDDSHGTSLDNFADDMSDPEPLSGCFPLEDADNTPCMPGRLEVNSFTLQLECKRVVLQAIFDPPKVRCAPGSRLDFSGNCREELFQKFRSRLLVNLDSRKGADGEETYCPPGFQLTPDGQCRNTALSGGGLG